MGSGRATKAKHADAIKNLDIEHMHDLLQAEKDGRLVVLPEESS